VQSVADEVKINPLVIITIIKTIVDIYNWWKNRRS
jgi:hypothetical protein